VPVEWPVLALLAFTPVIPRLAPVVPAPVISAVVTAVIAPIIAASPIAPIITHLAPAVSRIPRIPRVPLIPHRSIPRRRTSGCVPVAAAAAVAVVVPPQLAGVAVSPAVLAPVIAPIVVIAPAEVSSSVAAGRRTRARAVPLFAAGHCLTGLLVAREGRWIMLTKRVLCPSMDLAHEVT
jgi:hypothetical protein